MFKRNYYMVAKVKHQDDTNDTVTFETCIKGRMTIGHIREIEEKLKEQEDLKYIAIINYVKL